MTNDTQMGSKRLTIFQEPHGWYWCMNAEGESGWIPVENVRVVE
jgi:hypothetical protein